MLAIWAILPLVIALIFLVIYMRDRATGGYKVEKLQTRAGV
jgi:hypothetical protein